MGGGGAKEREAGRGMFRKRALMPKGAGGQVGRPLLPDFRQFRGTRQKGFRKFRKLVTLNFSNK